MSSGDLGEVVGEEGVAAVVGEAGSPKVEGVVEVLLRQQLRKNKGKRLLSLIYSCASVLPSRGQRAFLQRKRKTIGRVTTEVQVG